MPSELRNADTVCHHAIIEKPAKLVFSSRLLNVERQTYRAARRCCKAAHSKWTIRQANTADECGKGETWLGSLDDIWKLVQRLRRVKTYREEVGHPSTCGVCVL